MKTNRTTAAARIAHGLAETRVDLGLTRSELGQLAGCSDSGVYDAEHGRGASPALVTRLRLALIAYELSVPQPGHVPEPPAAAGRRVGGWSASELAAHVREAIAS